MSQKNDAHLERVWYNSVRDLRAALIKGSVYGIKVEEMSMLYHGYERRLSRG